MKRARKLISIFSLVALFLWLLPLGAFIKASQEEIACGGKRAFHCCMMSGKVHPEGSVKVSFSAEGSVEKSAKASGGTGDDFTAPTGAWNSESRAYFRNFLNDPVRFGFFQEIPVPPPKANPLF